MAPPGSKSKSHVSNGAVAKPDMSTVAESLSAKLSRKRTKTGCLTCRKRRIKCGEERPVCRNCVKSKRQCEGYAQRVVFKPPSFNLQQVPNGAHITFHTASLPGQGDPYQQEYPTVANSAPHGNFQQHHAGTFQNGYPPYGYPHSQFAQQPPPTPTYHQPAAQSIALGYNPQIAYQAQPVLGGAPAPYQPLTNQPVDHNHFVQGSVPTGLSLHTSPQTLAPTTPALGQANGQQPWQTPNAQLTDQKWRFSSPTHTATLDRTSPASAQSSTTLSWNHVSAPENANSAWATNGYALNHELAQSQAYQTVPPAPQPPHARTGLRSVSVNHESPEYYDHTQVQVDTTNSPNEFLARAAVETQDDDYYDVQSDEEMEVETSTLSPSDHERKRTLHTILQINNISIQDLQTRRYDTFISDGMLTHYRAEEVASPLRNPATARVFAHFISVTGPSLSIYERHPRNTSVLFTEGAIPFSQQGLWTYTMPMAALHHQGLLHAMLALASLHIARLQGASLTPSMQHYAWSLKRIHSCVSNVRKRYKLTTIAATMLLGFYEIMTADHMKWNMHLTGSKQLFFETDFVTMARQFRQMKAERRARRLSGDWSNSAPFRVNAQDEILDQIYDVDERVVSEFAGKEVRYDDHGRIITHNAKLPPQLDLSRFEILRDLYWWYLKQDAYQSIVSGNGLL